MTVYPQPLSTVRAADVAGCVHMNVFIAGHSSTCKEVWGAVRGPERHALGVGGNKRCYRFLHIPRAQHAQREVVRDPLARLQPRDRK